MDVASQVLEAIIVSVAIAVSVYIGGAADDDHQELPIAAAVAVAMTSEDAMELAEPQEEPEL